MSFTNWLMTHGTSAKVQDPGLVSGLGYYGWGLEFHQNVGSFGWVHIPVPTAMYITKSRAVRIYFQTGSSAYVGLVHVYNGGNKVAEFTGLKLTGPYKEFELPTPTDFESGMGISIGVSDGSDPDSTYADRKFVLYGAGALFEQ